MGRAHGCPVKLTKRHGNKRDIGKMEKLGGSGFTTKWRVWTNKHISLYKCDWWPVSYGM